nr:unnamed protein product [Callosobruchus chinensis]
MPVYRAAAHILAARMQQAVILGGEDEVKADLQEKGFHPIKVSRMTSRRSRKAIPLVKVDLPKEKVEVYKVQDCCQMKVTVEAIRRKTGQPALLQRSSEMREVRWNPLAIRMPAAEVEFLLKLHKDKPMHGIFYKHLEEYGLSQQLTFSFLRSSGLKSGVMGVNVPDARCRACRQAPETLMHLLSAWDIESVVENERCRIYWNYSFPTLELVQANKPDIVLLDHQQKTIFVIEFSAPAEVNIVSKEEEKRTKYQELLGQLRRLWPDYAVSLLVMVIGSLGGMRNTLLSALRVMPVCRAAAHILAARMQKAVILGARKYFSPSNLLTLHKTQIRPSLEYCSNIWGAAAPTALSILDAVQRGAIRLISDPALTCHLQPLSQRRAVGDLSLFYRYSNGFCSFELTAIIPTPSKPARCACGTSPHPKAVVLHTSRAEQYDHTFIPRLSRAWNGLPSDELIAIVGLFKSRVNKLLTFP